VRQEVPLVPGIQPEPGSCQQRRSRVVVQGIVQGVGFRPYVFRLATTLALAGFVRNDGRGVTIEVEGEEPCVHQFLARLAADAPPLAMVEQVAISDLPPRGDTRFTIVQSEHSGEAATLISPDVATCAQCLAELFDPADRRYRYPFINCTNCGPRFTIVRGIPYDRPLTTMAGFVMCERCRTEYEDPGNRRFHAQPNACPVCGPTARLVDGRRRSLPLGECRDAVAAAAAMLLDGAILAVKGLGGYHLACRADDEEVVRRLRARKHREEKPFALMVPDLAVAQRLVETDAAEARLMADRARPIVLARRRADAPVAHAVAPGHRDLGVMLPYTPLHHLLLADVGAPLVMTSGNRSDEPIAFRDDDAFERLVTIADLFLVHDRPIETRTDDSVVRVATVSGERRTLFVRRSRGYVPSPLRMPLPTDRAVLGSGGHLKNTFCLARGERAFVGHHIGDLDNAETLQSFTDGVEHVAGLVDITPDLIAHDLHPEYLSTKYALDRAASEAKSEPVGVQHHHAHLAACLAEHGECGPTIGIIFDGTGYGTDGTIWGGELLVGDLSAFERVGHLWPVRLPGGEAAIREPWRMACAWLVSATGEAPPRPRLLRDHIDEHHWRAVARLAQTGFASPVTTSVGRLFDAIAALCGVRTRVSYEGQAAIELEMAADARVSERYLLPVHMDCEPWLFDARDLVRAVTADIDSRRSVSEIAACVHNAIAWSAAHAAIAAAERHGITTVALSGGVFQNVLLLERTAQELANAGLRVLVPERLPPNDGGLSYGQAVIAACRSRVDAGVLKGTAAAEVPAPGTHRSPSDRAQPARPATCTGEQ
jgi:hydrogenase maturation protein HypF